MENENLPDSIARVARELKAIGLWEQGIEDRILGRFTGDGFVVVEKEFLGQMVKFGLQLDMRIGEGVVFHGYDVMVPRGPLEYAHFVHQDIDTILIESRFSQIDFSLIDPALKGEVDEARQLEYDELYQAMEQVGELLHMAKYSGDEKLRDDAFRFSEGMYRKYGAGTGFERHLIAFDEGWRLAFYNCQTFAKEIHINVPGNTINNFKRLETLSDMSWETGEKRREIMNANNLELLKLEMEKLGFSEALISKMEEHMSRNEDRFILYDVQQTEKGRAEMALHFNQSKSSEYYYFNKFDVVLEKQPPLAPGERYFVSSQRQGEEVLVKEFEMPSLAVKLFNQKMEGAKDIRGTAQLLAGLDVSSAKQLVAMEDGKITQVEKDFYRTLKNPSISQTFYLEKGNGFTLEQGLNLVQGRSVYREDMLDISNNEYAAWARLELDKPRDRSGNFEVHKIYEGYKFDFNAVLERYAFLELDKPKAREALETSLKNGNRAEVTVDLDGKKEKILAVVMPDFKQINLYALDGEVIKRELHQKEEKIADMSMDKDKGQKKEQQPGLAV